MPANAHLLPFGPGGLLFIGLYLCSLIVIGWLGYRSRREDSLRDFYLAGKGLGFIVLVLTLYATQYSGNTLFGFTGKSYRIGYAWVMSVHFMTAIIVCYLFFAPRLHALSRRRGFITPTDFLDHRYGSTGINLVGGLVMIVALANYLLAQLMAMGRAMEGLTAADPARAYLFGVIVLALIIVVYETLGGLRAVAWTDTMQGLTLIIGFGILLILVYLQFGSIADATEKLLASSDDIRRKVLPPNAQRCREWLSYVVLVGLGGALYPQAIQRIYAAKSAATLRRSLMVMAFFPLTTTLVALIVGIVALAHFPGLEKAQTDKVLTLILREVQNGSAIGYWLVVLLFSAILAAIMSTADSVLLSISSIATKDFYARYVRRNASEQDLTHLGKRISWTLMIVLVCLSIALKETTLIKLLDRKFDLLVQLAPAFIIGIHWRGLRAGPTFWGLVVGIAAAIVLAIIFNDKGGKIFGIHPGLFGLAVNLAVSVGGSIWATKKR